MYYQGKHRGMGTYKTKDEAALANNTARNFIAATKNSFLSPEEVGIVPEDTVEMEVVESIHVKGNVAPPPVVTTGEWWEENSAEDLGVLAFDKLPLLIEEKGGVLNNRIWSELCPRSFKADKVAKKVLKEAIAESDDIESVKVDKIRSFLYKSGGNANELYKQVYGKTLDS